MSDIVDKEKRSYIMSRVRSKGNKSTELKLITIFSELSIKRWRRGYPVIGKPDFVFLDKKIAVFVDGCFWHGHSCRTRPKSNTLFWNSKIERNIERDTIITKRFQDRNWRVIRIWECELHSKNRSLLLKKIKPLLETGDEDEQRII